MDIKKSSLKAVSYTHLAVIRADFTRQLARHFIDDFRRSVKELDEARILPGPATDKGVYGFTH